MIKAEYKVVAVMSGTSLDGIDVIYAIFRYDKDWSFKIGHAETLKYSSQWKALLSNLVNKSLEELKELDIAYSEYLANAIQSFITKYNLSEIDFVASHGHTALHQPENKLTYQIGNRTVLADKLQQKVICDFRLQDVEYGGQGAPLVPIGDRLLFHNYDYCLNLGGFANVSFEENERRIAFDICPVNIVINHYVSKIGLEYDDRGKIASRGNVHEGLLSQLNQLEFYQQPAPKSLGLEWVKLHVFPNIDKLELKTEDILRTFTEHIALQIASVLKGKGTSTLVTGGGAYNDFLIQQLRLKTKSEIIIPNNEIIEFKEALVFGLLGVLRDRNEVNCLKSVTGAKQDHSSGKILNPNS
ncbi:anhydro-N-acetylmuramic acid kinase [uncultured Winogradskyella sp.]|uniref:anhydro-N-acetylmuramic acid kinase n=1 Tax=uncultured Winogradskyella sp. TaxID=395353 RepID=UPI002637CFD1|nr:anhydro-N-acetylmuramic acid kinase [uncultured Winogradskyella sp.]